MITLTRNKTKTFIIALVIACVFLSAQSNNQYIMVKFTSKCCGTASQEPVLNYVSKFKKRNNINNIEVLTQYGLGWEGENALYFGTDNMNSAQIKIFIKGLNDTASYQSKHKIRSNEGGVMVSQTLISKASILRNNNDPERTEMRITIKNNK